MRGDNRSEGRIIMKSKRRQRLRGTCKWGGVTLCVLLFALWLASGWYWLGFAFPGTLFGLKATFGTLFIGTWNEPGLQLLHTDLRVLLGSAPPIWSWWHFGWDSSIPAVQCPIWFLFLLLALPTGYLFWSDHRKRGKPGHCAACGYDLTGNTSGTCPECGAETFKTTA